MQVLGITNYSHWRDTGDLRQCITSTPKARLQMQHLALQKLEAFAHVGITERLTESILSLAAAMQLKMQGPAWKVRCRHQ